jgi:hypothetical protein
MGRASLAASSLPSQALALFVGGNNFQGITSNLNPETFSRASSETIAIIIQNDRFADVSDVVDIYNGVTNTWTTAVLSSARYLLSAVSLPAQGLLVFAGGQTTAGASSRIDIFIGATGLWATDELSSPRRSVAGTFLSNQNVVILAGGFSDSGISLFRSLRFFP